MPSGRNSAAMGQAILGDTERRFRLAAGKNLHRHARFAQGSVDLLTQARAEEDLVGYHQDAAKPEPGGLFAELLGGVLAKQQLTGGVKCPGGTHGAALCVHGEGRAKGVSYSQRLELQLLAAWLEPRESKSYNSRRPHEDVSTFFGGCMYKLVLLRHGESTWNKENRFTGWTDVDLSETGRAEAKKAGQQLRQEGFVFDLAFTSVLKRAIRTLWITLDELDQMWIPIEHSWRLNERHYGALQGLNKAETAAKFGDEQVLIWRRSYDIPPPVLTKDDLRYPGTDPRYQSLSSAELPLTECLKDTVARMLPYWTQTIAPEVVKGRRVLITAHGNSLRALVKHLDQIPDDEIVGLNIPTGVPLVYELSADLKPIKHYYLGDPEEVARAAAAVAATETRNAAQRRRMVEHASGRHGSDGRPGPGRLHVRPTDPAPRLAALTKGDAGTTCPGSRTRDRPAVPECTERCRSGTWSGARMRSWLAWYRNEDRAGSP